MSRIVEELNSVASRTEERPAIRGLSVDGRPAEENEAPAVSGMKIERESEDSPPALHVEKPAPVPAEAGISPRDRIASTLAGVLPVAGRIALWAFAGFCILLILGAVIGIWIIAFK